MTPHEEEPGSATAYGEHVEASGSSQTDWSLIYEAGHGEPSPSSEAWEELSRRYWPAIYAYVRSSGRDVHEAADLTQGFVCDVMLGRRLVEAADPERGRFRTLLLTALKNYLAEQYRYQTRQKRSPSGDHRQLLELDRDTSAVIARYSDGTPEAAFAAQWSVSLVHRVLDRLQQECLDEELAAHWSVFELRVVRPMLFGEPPLSYAALVDRLDLKDAAQAANMMITVKRRFAKALYEEVGRTVGSPAEVEDELNALLRTLERTG